MFVLTSTQQQLEASAQRYLAERAAPVSEERGLYSAWPQLADLGWLGAAVPEEAGGYGGPVEMAVLARAIGAAFAPEPYLSACVLPTVFLSRTQTTVEPLQALFERVVSGGSIVVGAMDGEETVSFERIAGRIRLNGTLKHVVGGAGAQSILFSAADAKDPSRQTVLLLGCAAPGLLRESAPTIDGRESSTFRFSALDVSSDCEIRQSLQAFAAAREVAIVGQCAEMVGAMERLFLMTRDYLQQRKQFGQPLSGFQALRHRCADMYVEYQQSRAALSVGLRALIDNPLAPATRLVSACKLRVIKSARNIGSQAIQLHGAIALTEEYPLGRGYKRLLALEKAWGDSAWHARRVVEALPSGQG